MDQTWSLNLFIIHECNEGIDLCVQVPSMHIHSICTCLCVLFCSIMFVVCVSVCVCMCAPVQCACECECGGKRRSWLVKRRSVCTVLNPRFSLCTCTFSKGNLAWQTLTGERSWPHQTLVKDGDTHGVKYVCEGREGWTPLVGKGGSIKSPRACSDWAPPHIRATLPSSDSESDSDSGSDCSLHIPPGVDVQYSICHGKPGLKVTSKCTFTWTPIASRTRSRLKS